MCWHIPTHQKCLCDASHRLLPQVGAPFYVHQSSCRRHFQAAQVHTLKQNWYQPGSVGGTPIICQTIRVNIASAHNKDPHKLCIVFVLSTRSGSLKVRNHCSYTALCLNVALTQVKPMQFNNISRTLHTCLKVTGTSRYVQVSRHDQPTRGTVSNAGQVQPTHKPKYMNQTRAALHMTSTRLVKQVVSTACATFEN